MSRPAFFTEEELSAARRELARMPADVLAETHRVAERAGLPAIRVMAFLIRDMRHRASDPRWSRS